MAFNVTFFNSAKFFNNAQNQLEFTTETRFARYLRKFSLILGIKKNFASLKKILTFYASSIQQISIYSVLYLGNLATLFRKSIFCPNVNIDNMNFLTYFLTLFNILQALQVKNY